MKFIFWNKSKETAWLNETNSMADVIAAVWMLLSLKSFRQLIAAQVQLVMCTDSERHWKRALQWWTLMLEKEMNQWARRCFNLWWAITFHTALCNITGHFWIGAFQNGHIFTLRTHRCYWDLSFGWTRRMSGSACIRMPYLLPLSF